MTTTTNTTKCQRCGRTLSDTASIARGLGPVCARKNAYERHYKAEQMDKATEALEMGAVAVVPGRAVVRVNSTTGEVNYLATPHTCNCKAGLAQRKSPKTGVRALCWHTAAAARALGHRPRPIRTIAL